MTPQHKDDGFILNCMGLVITVFDHLLCFHKAILSITAQFKTESSIGYFMHPSFFLKPSWLLFLLSVSGGIHGSIAMELNLPILLLPLLLIGPAHFPHVPHPTPPSFVGRRFPW